MGGAHAFTGVEVTARQFVRCAKCRIHEVAVYGDSCTRCRHYGEERRKAKKARAKEQAWRPTRHRAPWCPNPAECAAAGKCGDVAAAVRAQ